MSCRKLSSWADSESFERRQRRAASRMFSAAVVSSELRRKARRRRLKNRMRVDRTQAAFTQREFKHAAQGANGVGAAVRGERHQEWGPLAHGAASALVVVAAVCGPPSGKGLPVFMGTPPAPSAI